MRFCSPHKDVYTVRCPDRGDHSVEQLQKVGQTALRSGMWCVTASVVGNSTQTCPRLRTHSPCNGQNPVAHAANSRKQSPVSQHCVLGMAANSTLEPRSTQPCAGGLASPGPFDNQKNDKHNCDRDEESKNAHCECPILAALMRSPDLLRTALNVLRSCDYVLVNPIHHTPLLYDQHTQVPHHLLNSRHLFDELRDCLVPLLVLMLHRVELLHLLLCVRGRRLRELAEDGIHLAHIHAWHCTAKQHDSGSLDENSSLKGRNYGQRYAGSITQQTRVHLPPATELQGQTTLVRSSAACPESPAGRGLRPGHSARPTFLMCWAYCLTQHQTIIINSTHLGAPLPAGPGSPAD
jgi:hypothetical protein